MLHELSVLTIDKLTKVFTMVRSNYVPITVVNYTSHVTKYKLNSWNADY